MTGRRSMTTAQATIAAGAGAALLVGMIVTSGGAPEPVSHAPKETGPAHVSARGFTIRSATVSLPEDEGRYPEGPGADVMNANCTSCHSASMALAQPRLSEAEWRTEVEKMRQTYKAPVAEADVPAITAYLTKISAELDPSAAGVPHTPDGRAAGDGGASG